MSDTTQQLFEKIEAELKEFGINQTLMFQAMESHIEQQLRKMESTIQSVETSCAEMLLPLDGLKDAVESLSRQRSQEVFRPPYIGRGHHPVMGEDIYGGAPSLREW